MGSVPLADFLDSSNLNLGINMTEEMMDSGTNEVTTETLPDMVAVSGSLGQTAGAVEVASASFGNSDFKRFSDNTIEVLVLDPTVSKVNKCVMPIEDFSRIVATLSRGQ